MWPVYPVAEFTARAESGGKGGGVESVRSAGVEGQGLEEHISPAQPYGMAGGGIACRANYGEAGDKRD